MSVAMKHRSEYRAVWTCESYRLGAGEEHVMAEETHDSKDEIAETYSAEIHEECMECKAFNDLFIGSLDRVEVIENGEIVETIDGDEFAEENGMRSG